MHTLCIVDGERDSNFVEMTYTMLPELKTFERGHMKSKRFPHMRNVIYIGQEKYRGMYNTAEILLLGNNIEDEVLAEAKKKVNCHDTVNMQYTSGTTGFPKGVMLTHYNIANNGFLTGEHMKFTQDAHEVHPRRQVVRMRPLVPLLRRGACHDELPHPRMYGSDGRAFRPVSGISVRS